MPSRVQTLNEMTQLKESEFGQPWPRHGLKLLYWFSTECISFDGNNEMVSCYNPKKGHFGFHYFENRSDQYGVKLLPDTDLPYYVVGNLHSAGWNMLPSYVREDYTGEFDDSNKDRIIASLDGEWFDRVYVTAHIDKSDYDINSTFRISRGLLTNISRHQSVDDFLSEMDFSSLPAHDQHVQIAPVNNTTTGSRDFRVDIENRDTAVPVNNKVIEHTQASTRSPGFWESYCTIL